MNRSEVLEKMAAENAQFLVHDIEDSDLVLIEGDSRSLLALSELIAAIAREGDYVQLSPTLAGNARFRPDSTKGLYIRCTDSKAARPDGATV